MQPACFQLADTVFPQVRVEAARRLVARGHSQAEAAKALGVSQAMVSRYLALPPASGPAATLAVRLADDLVAGLASKGTAGQDPLGWCRTLVGRTRPGGDTALDDVLAAEARLRAQPPASLMPAIGLNLARSLDEATREEDVLAYPARMSLVGGTLLVPAPPSFGASGHLARCLLALRREVDVAAIANVRGGHAAVAAARRAGLAVVEGTAPIHEDDADRRFRAIASHAAVAARAAPVATALAGVGAAAAGGAAGGAAAGAAASWKPGARRLLALHDPGAVGLEACLYIAGPDAGAVADAILRIHSLVNP